MKISKQGVKDFDAVFRYLQDHGLLKGVKIEKVKKPKGIKTGSVKGVGKGDTIKTPDLLRM